MKATKHWAVASIPIDTTGNVVLVILRDDRRSMQFFVIVQIMRDSGRVLPAVEPPSR